MRTGRFIGMIIVAIMISLASCAPTTTSTVVVKKEPKVVVVKKPRRANVVVVNRPYRSGHRRVVVLR